MQNNLITALNLIFFWEGGFAIRATEPGGAVNMGVSLQTLIQWRASKNLPIPTIPDLQLMPKKEAIDIYTSLYADKISFNDLPNGLDYCCLDSAVNEGVGGTIRFLADACKYNYKVGTTPKMIGLFPIIKQTSVADLIDSICNHRLENKKQSPEWSVQVQDGPIV